ncbi:hypothetical protein FRC12_016425 [Ceratobasidium sp. 428]|nr:hypothetical protein FRC09_012737 [Ceratobasidium sp. 395]KAG8786640.1 hypothetical protein FRC12_016425 [Ceratobasidium sp. 428]
MSKRLASFAGPSTPSSAPILAQASETTPTKPKSSAKNKNKGRDVTPSSPSPNPLSPNREPKSPSAQRLSKIGVSSPSHAPSVPKDRSAVILESPLQLYTRTTLKRTAADLEEWDTLASRRTFACARALVDRTTELDNALSILPEGVQPRSRMLGPRLRELNSKREEFNGYLVDLDVHFSRIAERVTGLEAALTKLTQRDGQESTERNPVWSETSWSFVRYVSHIVRLLRQLNRTRYTLNTLAERIRTYSLSSPDHSSQPTNFKSAPPGSETHRIPPSSDTSPTLFAQARTALASWSSEASRTSESVKEWVGACAAEIPAWDEIEVEKGDSDEEFDFENL